MPACTCARWCPLSDRNHPATASVPRSDFGFDPLGLLDPANTGGFVTPQWLAYSEVRGSRRQSAASWS